MKRRFFALILIAGAAVAAYARPTVLTLKETIKDSTIVYPESFETDTQELMKNWYLQNYAVLSDEGSKKPDVPTTDEDFIKRLKDLPTIIEMPYNQVVRSYIDMYTKRKRTLVEEMLGLSLYYTPMFEQALEKEGLPLELKNLPVIESALNPDAVSRVGATGLWQMMLGTAKGLGLEVNSLVDERRDPLRSSDAAARYLKQLYGIYNDWSLAIAAYNCGPGNVNKALRRAGGGKKDFWDIYFFLPAETRGYVPAFIAANYVMTYYGDHNIGRAIARRPVVTDTVQVRQRVHFDQIAAVLNIPVTDLRVLNPQYRHDEIPGDIRPYTLMLPSKQVYSYIVSEDSIVAHNAALYARRSVVNPAREDNSNGDLKLVIKYHKVKRGETISKVARRYGVSVSSLKRWNGLRRNSLRRGQTLRIRTYQRVEKPDEEEKEEELAANDKEQVREQDSKAAQKQAEEAAKEETTEENNTAEEVAEDTDADNDQGSVKYHRVRRGETLGKIAGRYGVTIAQLRKWNGLRSSSLRSGQRLKVYSDNQAEETAEVTASKARSSKSASRAETHTVRRGETLGKIAERYGVSVSDLREWNDISGSNIAAGQKLVLSASKTKKQSKASESKSSRREKAAATHTVRRGETLGEIADRYNVSVSDLREWNDISGSNIAAGQKLTIKDGDNKGSTKSKSSKKSSRKKDRTRYTTHKVRSGETLGEIAERNGTTASAIRKANGISGSNIRVGQRLKIPRK